MSPIEGELVLDPVQGLSVGQLEQLAEMHLVHRYHLHATDGSNGVITLTADPVAAVTELLRLAHLGAWVESSVREHPAGRPPVHAITAAAHRAWWPIVRELP